MKAFLFSLFMALISTALFAQDCKDQIQTAEKLYNEGSFTSSIEILNSCIGSLEQNRDSSIELVWAAYRLLALNHLSNNNNQEAKNAAYAMLEINPRYKPSKLHDPVEFEKLVNSITIIPRLSTGLALSFGTNLTLPSVQKSFFVAGNQKTYRGKNSIQVGLSTSFQINSQWAVDLSAFVTSKRYEVDYSFSDWDLLMEEDLTYLHIPLEVKYLIPIRTRIKPFLTAGGYGGALLRTNNSFYAKHRTEGQFSLENIESTDRRQGYDLGYIVGAGAYYKLGEGLVTLRMNYMNSSVNVTDESTRNDYNELRFSYFHLDDNFKLNNMSIGIGYSLILDYKVIKDK